jgi:DNA-directed RNA polymerase beta subunit
LFREYFKIQSKSIYVTFEKILYNDQTNYKNRLDHLILRNYQTVFKDRIVETGFKKAFKGNWGSAEHTKRIGAVQDLNRLSFNSALSHLRKTNLQMDSGAKLVGPRILNGSQWGLLDPIDTPDGGNIGLHKQLSLVLCNKTCFERLDGELAKRKYGFTNVGELHPRYVVGFNKGVCEWILGGKRAKCNSGYKQD